MLAKKYKHIIPLLLLLMVYTGCEKDEQTGQQPEEINNNNQSTNIQLEVYGFNNQKGNLAIAVFNNINSFDSESSAYLDSTVHINSTDMSVFLENINPGEYAISVFHDADESGDITFGGLFPNMSNGPFFDDILSVDDDDIEFDGCSTPENEN